MARIIGIDLGTTNSAVSFMDGQEIRLIPNDRGNRLTPSVVAFTREGDVLVGEAAKNQAVINAPRTLLAVKRHMGTDKTYTIDGKSYTPQMVSALILKKLKADAEDYLGEDVRETVITVPAHFSEKGRRATWEAGKLAGFTVKRIINEPTAAALAYAYELKQNTTTLVYDLGGGTFDVTCLEKQGDVFTVKATSGDSRLGGVDFDDMLLEKVLASFSKDSDINLSADPVILQQLREQVERAKIELSSREEALIVLPFIGSGNKPVHLKYRITRSEFESLVLDKIRKTVVLCSGTVLEANKKPDDITSLILSGGSSRIPLVKRLLVEQFHKEPEKKINPEEVVALGAGIQASLLSGQRQSIHFRDVTAYSLGVETEGGNCITVLSKNSPIPASASRVFTTVSDYQASVEIHVVQGDNVRVGENISLGRFMLSGIYETDKGKPRIMVQFSIDEDGMVNVDARDMKTGAEQRVSLFPGTAGARGKQNNAEVNIDLKIKSLLRKITLLLPAMEKSLDKEFKREISEISKSAEKNLIKGTVVMKQECRIALEAVIAELSAVRHLEEEALREQA